MGSRASSVRNSPESRMFLKMKNAFSGICDARMSAGVVGRPAFPEGQGLSGSEVFWQSRFRIAVADAKDGEKLSGVPERELPVVLVPDTEGVSVREPESAKVSWYPIPSLRMVTGCILLFRRRSALQYSIPRILLGVLRILAALLEKVAESSTVLALVRRQMALRYSVRA